MKTSEIDRFNILAEAAHSRWSDDDLTEYTSASWGFFSYGDAPAGIGGGMGSFVWPGSRTATLNFIAEVLPFSPPGPSTDDCFEIALDVGRVIDDIKLQRIDVELGRKRLNKTLRSFSQIEWIGTFKDLRAGQSPYARKVIKEFRRGYGIAVSVAPIEVKRAELADFKEFLETYGI